MLKLAGAATCLLAVVVFGLSGAGQVVAGPAAGGAATYDFQDPKGVNGIGFMVNSRLEPFFGTGSGVSGKVSYDPADPAALSGSISIDATTLRVTHPVMTEHMLGEKWLDTAEHPLITVSFGKVTAVEEGPGGDRKLTIEAKLSALGVTLDKTLVVSASHVPGGAAARGGAEAGDLLVLRSTFVVSRKDLGLAPDVGPDHVGQEIAIIVGIAGYQVVQ